MTDFNLLPIIRREKHLGIDDLSPEDIDKKFDQLVQENDLKEQLETASHPEELIDSAYKNLNLVVDVHEHYSAALSDENREELARLIEDDAYTLIAGRTAQDEYQLHEITSQFEKAAELPVDSRMRDLEALARSLDILEGNEVIETGIYTIARQLPSHTTRPLLEAVNLAKGRGDASFKDEYEKLQSDKRTGIFTRIEHMGQYLALTPAELKIAEQRGDLNNPSHKERNFFRKSGTTNTILGDIALTLSKRFRK